MKPRVQTKVGEKGNCFVAAAASILELPINMLPRVKHSKEWLNYWRRWLRKRGMGIVWFEADGRTAPSGWAVLTVKCGYEAGHAVVCFDGEIIHDPMVGNLEKAREARRLHWYVFTILNPAEKICS